MIGMRRERSWQPSKPRVGLFRSSVCGSTQAVVGQGRLGIWTGR